MNVSKIITEIKKTKEGYMFFEHTISLVSYKQLTEKKIKKIVKALSNI